MDLKNFKVLSKSDYDALSERDQVKYELQLEAFKEQEQTRIATEAAQKAVEAIKLDLQKENKDLLDKLSKDNEDKLKELADKHQLDLETMTAELKRNKIADIGNRMKGFSEHITEKLSTEEGETMIKDFFKGQRESLNFDVDAEALKAPITVPAGSVAPEFIPIVGPGHDDIHARNAIPVFPTISDVIKFVQFTYTGATAGFTTVAPGAAKPELLYTSALEEANVRKIAGWLDVPDEIMDDVAGFRAWIAYELPKAYLDAEDFMIFKGDGTGINLLGLWTQADVQTLPFGSVTGASNEWDKLMAAITEIRTRKRATSAAFVSPLVYMELWINKGTGSGEYTYPIVMGQDGILYVGGVPIYWSNVFVNYEGLVGDFARGASIHQRKAMNIAYSGENKDNFVKNIVTIRLEGRIALAIRVPNAFLRLAPFTS
jgi:HK97 family phage major capsid protein